MAVFCTMVERVDRCWEQRFANYRKAMAKLREVAQGGGVDGLSELEKEGVIQRFKYTYELAWKTLQDFLKYKGYVDIVGPTPVLKQAFEDGYILDEVGWKRMKKARELTSHTYDIDVAEDVATAVIGSYFPLLDHLEKRLEQDNTSGQLSLFVS